MSQDPHKNNDLFPNWDFSEPDWLQEDPSSFTKEDPAPSPSPVRRPREPEPARCGVPHRDESQPQKSAPSRRSGENMSWEQARAAGRNRQSAPARRAQTPVPAARKRRRRRSSRNTLVIALILILIGGMVFAGWQLSSILLGYKRDRSAYEQLANTALTSMAEQEDGRTILHTPDPANPQEEQPEQPSEIPFTVDWEYLSSVNPDIIGWLYCPDTVINYPVVQSEDHDYYLSHGFEGQTNSSGTLFADRGSVAGITQSNFIIYGHNMKDESMFGSFKHYVDRSYYEKHPILYYLTPTESYRVELVCAHIVEATTNNFPTYFSSTDDQQSYLNRITSSSYWVNYDAVTTDYQLMTFSTCTSAGGYADPRLLVHGVMIPIQ